VNDGKCIGNIYARIRQASYQSEGLVLSRKQTNHSCLGRIETRFPENPARTAKAPRPRANWHAHVTDSPSIPSPPLQGITAEENTVGYSGLRPSRFASWQASRILMMIIYMRVTCMHLRILSYLTTQFKNIAQLRSAQVSDTIPDVECAVLIIFLDLIQPPVDGAGCLSTLLTLLDWLISASGLLILIIFVSKTVRVYILCLISIIRRNLSPFMPPRTTYVCWKALNGPSQKLT